MKGRKRVFIVHGHDHGTRDAVSAKLNELGYEPCILSEQISLGQQLIDKFETEASDAFFAVVILSMDDQVTNPDGTVTYRARQNVVFELGYFYKKFGTTNFCVLREEGAEEIGDVKGIVYHAYTRGNLAGMFLRLQKDLAAAPRPAPEIQPEEPRSIQTGKQSQVFSGGSLSGGMHQDNSKGKRPKEKKEKALKDMKEPKKKNKKKDKKETKK